MEHAGCLTIVQFIENNPESARLFLPVLEGNRIKASLLRFISNRMIPIPDKVK